MGSVTELEVNTMTSFFALNVTALFCCIMFKNELFQEQECSFVIDLLSDLHLWLPQMRRVHSLAILTLQILNNIFNNESLLNLHAANYFFLNGYLNFELLGMRLCPDERSINELDSTEALDMLETKLEKLRWLQIALCPWWSLIPITFLAMMQLKFFWNSFTNV